MIWGAIIVAIIAFVAAIAFMPKPPAPPGAAKGNVPEAKDGKRVVRVYGTLWIDDPAVLAMKQTGTEAIRR